MKTPEAQNVKTLSMFAIASVPRAIEIAPITSTVRAPIPSTSRPAKGTTSIRIRRRAFIAPAYVLRVQPNSSVMGFRSGDIPYESAEWALTTTTPTPRATQARQVSPNGPVSDLGTPGLIAPSVR